MFDKLKQKLKLQTPDPQPEFLFDEAELDEDEDGIEFGEDESAEPEIPTFTEIGSSPVPGLTLRHVLRGQEGVINCFAWSPDGLYLASSAYRNIQIWDARTGICFRTLQGHTDYVTCIAWSPDGWLASGAADNTIRLWNMENYVAAKLIKTPGISISLAWMPSGDALISSLNKRVGRSKEYQQARALWMWDTRSDRGKEFSLKEILQVFSLSPDGKIIAGAGYRFRSKTSLFLDLFDPITGKTILDIKDNTSWQNSNDVAWEAQGNFIATGSQSGVVYIWDPYSGQLKTSLEGHTKKDVTSVSISSDGKLLASRAESIRLWRCDTWACVAVLKESLSEFRSLSLAFHPRLPVLATLAEKDAIIRIWELNEPLLLGQAQESVHYTTAKLVLVGDSGVGKTGLGWRLAHGKFKEHASTHGQQFWPIQQLGLKRKDGTECEAVLWDLAGQHVYRQIHSIFLENVAAALVLFDPSNRQDPLKGAQFWLEQLKGKGQLPPAVLVGARVDRGAPALSQQELDQFCQRYGIGGGYISTSAKAGEGLEDLLERLKAQIPWEEMTATVTTVTFKRIKDYVLALKEKPDRQGALVSPSALREQLQATDPDWHFTDAEMMTAVGHLETHGYVAVLRSSAGDEHILLTPELLVTLACSIVLLADKHPRELGAVSESELLQGKYPFDELEGLSQTESQILLDAAILRFLEHKMCFRETLGEETLLIFPGLIKQKRPLQDDLPASDDISYVVRGRVENLYASLVVLLGYTPSFTRINQWQNQAQYEMDESQICGFRLIEDREGEIEVVLYYGDRLPPRGRTQFQELFEQFLYQRDVEVTRFPPVSCPKGHRQERATVIKRVREAKRFVFCEECGTQTGLPDFDKPQTIGIHASPWLQREEAAARLRSAYEVQLTKVKGYRRAWAAPRCYLSHLPEQAAQAEKLTQDLRDAGVYVVEQATQVQPDDFVIVLDTPDFKKAFQSSASAIAADAPLVRARLGKRQLISLKLAGQNVPHELEDCTLGDFCDDTHYAIGLFDLVLNLYAIPFTHAGFAPLRQSLHAQWEQTLAKFAGQSKTQAPKVFISYARADEPYKDELVKMLAGLKRQGIIDTWNDRMIEPGEEWFPAITKALNECDLAVLLVSTDFIASRFIHDEELPVFINRRQQEGMTILSLIVRDCLWQSEPVLKDLQALPRDGKAVITFAESTGERDRVWMEIGRAIEKLAKAKSTP